MNCLDGRKYVQGTDGLDVISARLEEAIADIRSVLFAAAETPCRAAVKSVRVQTNWGIENRYLLASTRIAELSQQDWYLNVPRQWQNARGIQDPLYDKILLKRGNWCRETLLHEALHRFSIFSAEFEIRPRFAVFEDGITEFLVGFILFKKCPYCYSSWTSNAFSECSMTYPWSVRRFYAFCNFVNVKSLIDLYFWKLGVSWATAHSQFILDIHNSGYPDFGDVLGLYGAEPTQGFFMECEKRFGGKFRVIYSSKMDYSNLKI